MICTYGSLTCGADLRVVKAVPLVVLRVLGDGGVVPGAEAPRMLLNGNQRYSSMWRNNNGVKKIPMLIFRMREEETAARGATTTTASKKTIVHNFWDGGRFWGVREGINGASEREQ